MAKIFKEGSREGLFIDEHPQALTDVVWSLFSGLVLWEESKRIIDPGKDYLKSTMDIAFNILTRGIKKPVETA